MGKALERIRKEDQETGRQQMKSSIWMADHNMVRNPEIDELRGTGGKGGKEWKKGWGKKGKGLSHI